MKLREQALLKVSRQSLPTSSRPAIQRFPWKTSIVTTVFWIGEPAGANNPVSNVRVRGTRIGQGITADLTRPIRRRDATMFQCRLCPGRIRSIVRFRIAMCAPQAVRPEAALVIPWFKQAYPGTWSFSVQGSLGCYSKGKSHLLRAVGRLRPVSHGSFPIRVPK